MDSPPAQFDPPPRTHSGIKTNHMEGMGKIGDCVKILLNVENILYEEEFGTDLRVANICCRLLKLSVTL